jgi:hypothetical protein
MKVARFWHTAAATHTKIFIFSGIIQEMRRDDPQILATGIEILDLDTMELKYVSNQNSYRRHLATAVNNEIYLVDDKLKVTKWVED